jgi:hypothetical protein
MPWTQKWVPPDVLTAPPLDCCGAADGDCRLLEPLLAELGELDEPDELEELDDPVLAAAVVAPGSRIATMPAATTLAIPAVAVIAVSRRRPRARSATARATARDAVRDAISRGAASRGAVCRGAVGRAGNSGLLMSPVWRIEL